MSRHIHRRPKPALPVPASDGKHPPLSRWQARFALWYATQPRQPSVIEQASAASRIADTPITYDQVKRVKVRKDWRELHDAMARGGVEAAAKVLETNLPLAMEARVWAIEQAKATGDHRALGPLTDPLVDRAWPKYESPLLQQHIHFVLSEKQLRLMDTPQPEITAELIPNEPIDVTPLPDPPKLPEGTMTLADAMKWRKERERLENRPTDDSMWD